MAGITIGAWMSFVSGCNSPANRPSSQSAHSILTAGGANAERDSGTDLSLRAAAGEEIPKKKWVSAYGSKIRKATVVALVRLDGNNVATCVEVWKSQNGNPRVGEVITTGIERNPFRFNAGNYHWYDPDKGIVVFFNRFPSPTADSQDWVSRDGLVMGNLTLDELRAIALQTKKQ